MNNGFHQLVLSKDSRNIMVFSTHAGLRRYKTKIKYGISASPAIFQNEIDKPYTDWMDAINISDDIIIFGKSQQEHDKNLEAVLERLRQKNLTLNRNKCFFSRSSIKFYGCIFSGNGISADQDQVDCIKNAPRPNSPSEVKSFLGMTGFISRFIPNYTTITEPLRRLTKQDEIWMWTDKQENSFQTLKDTLTSDTIMAYFDPSKETELKSCWVSSYSQSGEQNSLVHQPRFKSYRATGDSKSAQNCQILDCSTME